MSTSLVWKRSTAFVCECRNSWRSACTNEPFYKKHGGKHYCVLHYPAKDKRAAFSKVIRRKIAAKSFDFRGVWFPDALNFRSFGFDAPEHFGFDDTADFRYATFSEEADFSYASFTNAYFCNAAFNSDAYFLNATFNAYADFSYATFLARATFRYAPFIAEADFTSANCAARTRFHWAPVLIGMRFSHAAFNDCVVFGASGQKPGFNDQ